MSWITLTENDIKRRLVGPELAAYRSVALAEDQEDPLSAVLEDVLAEVWGRVAACSKNTMGAPGTIPASCKRHALALATWDLLIRVPGNINDDRTKAHDDALEFLDQVAGCKVGIESPEAVEVADSAFPRATPTVRSRSRQFTRGQQDGI